MRNSLVLVACLGLMVGAQILWKVALGRIGVIDIASAGLGEKILELLRSWRILLGLSMFGVATLLWLDLLSRNELSFLYPFMSLSYVLAFFAGWWILGESPEPVRIAGIVIICIGIALVARTGG